MKLVRYIGLTGLLSSLVIFLAVFFMVDYRLTDEILYSQLSADHYFLIRPRVAQMIERTYSSPVAFANSFDLAIKSLNSEYRSSQQWDKVIYDPYTMNIMRASAQGFLIENSILILWLTFGMGAICSLMYLLPQIKLQGPKGIKNNGIFKDPLNNKGWVGMIIGTILILFYILLYFYDAYVMNWVILVQPIKKLLVPNGQSSQWFLYGLLYTFAVLVMGIRMLIKYRHSSYQQVRTLSVMFFQTAFAFLIPEILVRLNQPYFDFKNMWPLDYDFFDAWHIKMLTAGGEGLGIFMFVWGITLFVIGVPLFTYFFGKRWYCSWVCGCGGLAETAGDPFRQLSDKSINAWKVERYLIHGVLAFALIMTVAVVYNFITGTDTLFGLSTYTFLRQPYGFYIGALFSGVVGTGFYPFMGNRVWCRFGCPLAAYLGIIQRFKSKFRITTNGGQCISCGNCSTYCEMGIDVRWYAQRGQNIVRSSCVGCGLCSAVCPRGVLNLENNQEEGRFGQAILIGNDSITLNK